MAVSVVATDEVYLSLIAINAAAGDTLTNQQLRFM